MVLARLFLLFTIVPIIELALLIEVGQYIGTLNTVLLVLATGAAGALLVRAEGFSVIRRLRREAQAGVFPGNTLVDGALILAGGLLLLTPGLLTDALGLLALVPVSRRYMRHILLRWIQARFLRRS